MTSREERSGWEDYNWDLSPCPTIRCGCSCQPPEVPILPQPGVLSPRSWILTPLFQESENEKDEKGFCEFCAEEIRSFDNLELAFHFSAHYRQTFLKNLSTAALREELSMVEQLSLAERRNHLITLRWGISSILVTFRMSHWWCIHVVFAHITW